jgi:hypothetical protein
MSKYTTVSKVREIAGFVGNSNVPDIQISDYIDMATAHVNSKLSDAYSLPLRSFYQNTIVFSGTGTGTETLTITIAGINYDVEVVLDQTASQAADLFRIAVNNESNATFIVDALGGGATVTIKDCNQNGSASNVTVTSTDPQTVQGITATSGTITQVPPDIIETITAQIAAAYLLIQEYGSEAQDTDKDGFKRLAIFDGDANNPGLLTQIQMKTMKIFDCAGNELSTSSTQQPSFFPTEVSRTDEENPTANRFTMNQKF